MNPLIPYFDVVRVPVTDQFSLQGFGILVGLAFLVGAFEAMRRTRRLGLDPNLFYEVAFRTFFGVFIGGHLGHLLLYEPRSVLEDPMVIFQVWKGLSSYGGFIASFLLCFWYMRGVDRKIREANAAGAAPPTPRIDIWAYGDCALFGLTLAWFFGRMGCFVAHDHPGTETTFWLGVKGMLNPNNLDPAQLAAWISAHTEAFPSLAGAGRVPAEIWQQVAYHDLGLYEAIWSLTTFGLFRLLDHKPRPVGFFVGLTFVSYGPVRLLLDALRHASTDTRYLGLTPAQYLSVAMTALGVWVLWVRRAARAELQADQ